MIQRNDDVKAHTCLLISKVDFQYQILSSLVVDVATILTQYVKLRKFT